VFSCHNRRPWKILLVILLVLIGVILLIAVNEG
jgi:hypothetical protein